MKTLEELAGKRTALMEDLARLAGRQKALVSEIRAGEKEQKALLADVEEHVAGEPLSHEDVERWARSVHWQFARTMPGNPHMYAHVRWCDEGMFYRVVRHIRKHGYEQRYGSRDYTCYDAAGYFMWTMGAPVDETILINRKPDSLRPGAKGS